MEGQRYSISSRWEYNGMVICGWVGCVYLRPFINIYSCLPHHKRWNQVVYHGWDVNCILYHQNIGFVVGYTPDRTVEATAFLGKNIGQQYCWCSLMWLMPLRSLSNCDYELIFYLRLRLGPIHSNQVMGTDPVGSYHGTRNSWSNSIKPTYPY